MQAIPQNLLEIAAIKPNTAYLQHCKQAGIKPHPAQFLKLSLSCLLNFSQMKKT